MRIVVAVPEAHVTAPVLDGALEAVTRLNEQLIKSGASPTSDQLIAAGAKWRPEAPGDEHFDHGALISSRGHGDCDDWAPLAAASLRVSGEDPGARAVVRKSGEKRWHAVVQRTDGSVDDPSLEAGMPGPAKRVGVRGAWLPAMQQRLHGVGGTYIATPHLALRPVADRHGQLESWQARADLPWHWQPGKTKADLAMATLHQSPVSDQAVVGAVRGAYRLGAASGFAHPEHLARMAAIADACEGCPWEELAETYGPAHADAAGAIVGSFFGKLGKLAKGGLKFVTKNPLGKLVMSAVPGASLATQAFNMASPLLKTGITKGHHVQPGQPRAAALVQPVAIAKPNAGGDLNVVLLSKFGDLLAEAYRTNRAAPVAVVARPAMARHPAAAHAAAGRVTRVQPGTAWPRG